MKKRGPILLFIVLLLSCCLLLVQSKSNPASFSQLDVSAFYYAKLSNLTKIMSNETATRASFCISDPNTDWNMAFGYTNLEFLATCMERFQGQVAQRLCTAVEIKLYLNNVFKRTSSQSSGYLIPNRNCNLSTWLSGCEPGWACSINPTVEVDLQNAHDIPSRTVDCEACCEGFFCPQGLTCMMPCPLGAYCPLAAADRKTGLCDPYHYQLPAGHPNHTCGGANMWADVVSTPEIFCSAGSYCPTTVDKEPCGTGHYCRIGSTFQSRCSKLIACKSNTANQNIHTYGILVIIALVALLLIIYNCFDQMLAIRDRRRAKSRERAARIVKETGQARARWKAAKDAAKKHVNELQANLSWKFSRKKQQDELRILDETDLEVDNNYSSPLHSSESGAPDFSPFELDGTLKESNDSTARVHALKDETHSDAGPVVIEDKNSKKKMLKAKAINTETQMFKYAYSEIEKEKLQEQKNENLTFSRVISMAANSQSRKRTMIEVAFRDLTLTLKGKRNCLLKCLTGRIIPGHITAVMGPSGAGKTTFISALAGKPTGCKQSGLILLNGRSESIHSYKKIMGFVPQDDIVHGNLTVEENLWFSARCRLSADLRQADKVLIVERVIESLGLQEVRDSLVGTVEKRGISGGQRKRVNVGLEMVIEPSLLFLDEPTSGLDSSSSRLLLQALRHEAHAAVNICMVVHQPSYALFQMFDNLILLAKGGLMAYNGPAREAEEYFKGLGIHVPERINPPDYYIDILEGLLERSKGPVVNYKELPLRWMLHNGYPVPEDMQSSAARLAASTSDATDLTDSTHQQQTFAGELWQDMRFSVELQRDHIYHNFLNKNDLSGRRTPSIFLQYKYFLGRISKQRLRESRLQATDYLVLLLAGACLGSISNISDENFGASGYSYTVIAVSLLCQIAALRSFSLDKLQYWRESASGVSSLAHFLAKDAVDHFNTLIKPVVYLSMFYYFTNPRSTFLDNYIVLVCLVYCVTGMGYAFAIFLDPGPAQLFSVLLPVCLTLLATQAFTNDSLKFIANLCYPKWALEAFVVSNAKRYYGVWLMSRCGVLHKLGYSLHAWGYCVLIVLAFGVVSRILAFIGMVTLKKK
ncbi:ABC transporter G member 24, variant 2 [Ancistrocladus abbreviatus]